jgi:hypothetical protein
MTTLLNYSNALCCLPSDIISIIGKFGQYKFVLEPTIVFKLPMLKVIAVKKQIVVIAWSSKIFIYMNELLHQTLVFDKCVIATCIDERNDRILILHTMSQKVADQPLQISIFNVNGEKLSSFSLLNDKNMYGLRVLVVDSKGQILLRTYRRHARNHITIIEIYSFLGELLKTFEYDIQEIDDFAIGPSDTIYLANFTYDRVFKTDKIGCIIQTFDIEFEMKRRDIHFRLLGIFCDSIGNFIFYTRSSMHIFSPNGQSLGILSDGLNLSEFSATPYVTECGRILTITNIDEY